MNPAKFKTSTPLNQRCARGEDRKLTVRAIKSGDIHNGTAADILAREYGRFHAGLVPAVEDWREAAVKGGR